MHESLRSNPEISILYRDEHYILVHKPANMLVHKSMIDRHETVFLMKVLRDQIGQYVYPVHRLDKPTCGVIMFALSSEAASQMGGIFEQGKISKTYIAVVRGYAEQSQTIDYALKEKLDKIADAMASQDKPAQLAVTVSEKLAQIEVPFPVGRYPQARFSLVRLRPITGRKHQLRRHMSHVNHPIIGDTTHGDGKQNAFVRQHFDFTHLALCATQLQFLHPFTGQSISVKTPLSEKFQNLVDLFDVDGHSIYHPEQLSFS